LVAESGDFRIDVEESVAQRLGQSVRVRGEGGPSGPQDAQVNLGGKERDMEAIGRDGVAGGTRHAIDEALEAQPTEVVAHSSRCIAGWVEAEQAGNQGAQVAVAEAGLEDERSCRDPGREP